MNSLLELPMKAAGFVARTSLRLVEAAAETAAARLRAARAKEARMPGQRPKPEPRPGPGPRPGPQPRPPVPSRPPAPRRDATPPVAPAVADVPPPAPAPPAPPVAPPVADVPPVAPEVPPEPPITVVPELTHGQAARIREAEREAEVTEDSPGAVVHVDEPWHGYTSMKAPEIIDRLRVSDDAVKAVVLLYEGSHRGRKTVLRAAGG
jgi:hypothetical protein